MRRAYTLIVIWAYTLIMIRPYTMKVITVGYANYYKILLRLLCWYVRKDFTPKSRQAFTRLHGVSSRKTSTFSHHRLSGPQMWQKENCELYQSLRSPAFCNQRRLIEIREGDIIKRSQQLICLSGGCSAVSVAYLSNWAVWNHQWSGL